MWRNIFLLIFVILQVRGALKLGDAGVCKRSRSDKLICCRGWKLESKKCVPICNLGCGEGRCNSPEKCICESPLTHMNGKCEQPKCNLPYCMNPICSYTDGNEKECKCSDGYEYKGNYSCVPKCTPGCVNGDCVAPDICSCLEGYRNVRAWECEPICHNCENGNCTAPETCSCNVGYTKRNNTCKPTCRDCDNGECIAPGKCKCNNEYENDKDGKCKPICNTCDNGDCIAPGVCQCKEEYEKIDDRCRPICKNSCINGFCSAPDTCACDKGYEKDADDGTCKPICTKECINGTCVGPDECKCLDGYVKAINDFVCKPKCFCENGKCIATDNATICMCNKGYSMVNGSCKPVCSNKCVNGFCIAPDLCICSDGYSSNLTDSSVCTKPCVSCNYGVCNTHGECICQSGYEYINSSCIPLVVDCAACESYCNGTGCWCNDSRRCDRPEEAKIDIDPTSTGLAGLQILWLGGAIGAIVLVTTVIFIFRHMWKRQQEIRSKEIAADVYPYGSVAYTVSSTLQNCAAVSVPNLYSEDNDNEDERDDEDESMEAADGLLPDNDLNNDE